jgi:ribosomal protein S6--L-glutamate ligase
LVNDVRALTNAVDKFRSSWLFARAAVPAPPVLVTQRLDEAEQALAQMGTLVVKPLYGSLGIGVERLGPGDESRLPALLDEHHALYLQAFVAPELDVRAFVIGDRVAAAMARRPQPGEFRANIHQGAEARAHVLDRFTAEVAVRATRALGLDYSGVDLLITDGGPLVLEANGTPSFRGIARATGRDMAQAIVEHALGRVPATATKKREERWPPRDRRAT